MNRAIFLDRDGTLIEDKGYIYKRKDFKPYDGVVDGLKMLKRDYSFFIITNQPGIEKGFIPIDKFHKFNDFIVKWLKAHNIRIERIYFCPHIDGCGCKKPSTKFIDEISSEFKIDLPNSWVMGDHPSDIAMGKNAGCKSAYLLTGHGRKHFQELKLKRLKPTIIAQNFLSAVKQIKLRLK